MAMKKKIPGMAAKKKSAKGPMAPMKKPMKNKYL